MCARILTQAYSESNVPQDVWPTQTELYYRGSILPITSASNTESVITLSFRASSATGTEPGLRRGSPTRVDITRSRLVQATVDFRKTLAFLRSLDIPFSISQREMASKSDDTIPERYPYFWDKEYSDMPLKDFLAKVSTCPARLFWQTFINDALSSISPRWYKTMAPNQYVFHHGLRTLYN